MEGVVKEAVLNRSMKRGQALSLPIERVKTSDSFLQCERTNMHERTMFERVNHQERLFHILRMIRKYGK